MQLTTNRLLLNDILESDLDEIHQLNSIPEVDKYNVLGLPESIETTRALVNDLLRQQQEIPRMSFTFGIRIAESGALAGMIGLILGRPKYRSGEVWYKFNPVYWRMGFAFEALTRILDFGFNELKLHRIEAGCATENTGSIKVLEKVGMTREGSKRGVLPIRGEWVDNYFYAILDTDRKM